MKKAFFITMLFLPLLLAGCASKEEQEPENTPAPPSFFASQQYDVPVTENLEAPSSSTPAAPSASYANGAELFASVESQEEAEELARLYGIDLVEFRFGYATFHTDENPVVVIQRGEANDWPPLEINHIGGTAD